MLWYSYHVPQHNLLLLFLLCDTKHNFEHKDFLNMSLIFFNLLDHPSFWFSVVFSCICSYMFFTDMGYANENMRLERAFMDGSNRIELVKNRLGIPTGITVDIVNKRIYWSDSHFDTVETVTYHGLDRWGWPPNICPVAWNRNACTACLGYTFHGCSSPGK